MISLQIKTSEFAHNFRNCAFHLGLRMLTLYICLNRLCEFVFVIPLDSKCHRIDKMEVFTAEMRRLPFNLLNIERMKCSSGRHLVFVLIIKCLVPFFSSFSHSLSLCAFASQFYHTKPFRTDFSNFVKYGWCGDYYESIEYVVYT